jgi:hypothetical protein
VCNRPGKQFQRELRVKAEVVTLTEVPVSLNTCDFLRILRLERINEPEALNKRHQIKKTPRNPLQTIDRIFPCAIASSPRKHRLGLFVIEILYRHQSPLSLSASNSLHRVLPLTATELGQGIHEYQPKRENMLEFKNFRMVNLVYVGSPWSQSLTSLTSLRGSKVSSSLSKFSLIVRVDVPG